MMSKSVDVNEKFEKDLDNLLGRTRRLVAEEAAKRAGLEEEKDYKTSGDRQTDLLRTFCLLHEISIDSAKKPKKPKKTKKGSIVIKSGHNEPFGSGRTNDVKEQEEAEKEKRAHLEDLIKEKNLTSKLKEDKLYKEALGKITKTVVMEEKSSIIIEYALKSKGIDYDLAEVFYQNFGQQSSFAQNATNIIGSLIETKIEAKKKEKVKDLDKEMSDVLNELQVVEKLKETFKKQDVDFLQFLQDVYVYRQLNSLKSFDPLLNPENLTRKQIHALWDSLNPLKDEDVSGDDKTMEKLIELLKKNDQEWRGHCPNTLEKTQDFLEKSLSGNDIKRLEQVFNKNKVKLLKKALEDKTFVKKGFGFLPFKRRYTMTLDAMFLAMVVVQDEEDKSLKEVLAEQGLKTKEVDGRLIVTGTNKQLQQAVRLIENRGQRPAALREIRPQKSDKSKSQEKQLKNVKICLTNKKEQGKALINGVNLYTFLNAYYSNHTFKEEAGKNLIGGETDKEVLDSLKDDESVIGVMAGQMSDRQVIKNILNNMTSLPYKIAPSTLQPLKRANRFEDVIDAIIDRWAYSNKVSKVTLKHALIRDLEKITYHQQGWGSEKQYKQDFKNFPGSQRIEILPSDYVKLIKNHQEKLMMSPVGKEEIMAGVMDILQDKKYFKNKSHQKTVG